MTKSNEVLLADIRLFAVAAESANLAAAALKLGVPKASATRQLQRLEAALGRALLHRTAGRFMLTDEGRLFLPSARRTLEDLDRSIADLRSETSPLHGTLRITAPYTFGQAHVAPIVPAFLRQHPDLSVVLELSSRKVDLLADEADIALRIGDIGNESLVGRVLREEEVVLCASSVYAAARKLPTDAPALANHPLLTIGLNHATNGLVLQTRSQVLKVGGFIALRSNEPSVVAEAVKGHAGIGLVPRRFVARELAGGSIVRVLPELDLLPYSVYAVYGPGRRHAHKVRAFMDFLVAYLASESA